MHLNVPERAELEPQTVSHDEVAEVIREELAKDRFFPPDVRPWEEGESVYEGFFLEKQETGCIVHYQRPPPLQPYVLAEAFKKRYRSVDKAIRVFIKKEFQGNIDGIPIT